MSIYNKFHTHGERVQIYTRENTDCLDHTRRIARNLNYTGLVETLLNLKYADMIALLYRKLVFIET